MDVKYTINEQEKNALIEVCAAVQAQISTEQNQDLLVRKSQEVVLASGDGLRCLSNLIQAHIRSDQGTGVFHVSNLPVVEDSRVLSAVLGFLLGQVVRYEGEGDYIIEIKVQRTSGLDRPSFRNSREFLPHTDLSYAPQPPPYFFLHSLHNDRQEGGFSTWCSVQDLVARLSEDVIAQLAKPQFIFPAPSHYQGGGAIVHSVLQQGPNGSFYIRFRRDGIRAKSRAGIAAVVELVEAMTEVMKETNLEDNSVFYLDNRRCLHGRTAFLHSPASLALRHLNRVYVE